jgi:predicted amidohydrolase
MRIAMAQISGSSDPAANRKVVAEQIAQAALGGAELVVFPESTLRRSEADSEPPAPTAERLDGLFVSHLSELARRHNITVMAGMTERIDCERVRARNTIVVIDHVGKLIGSYRKIHLFDALGSVESAIIVPGDGSTLVFSLGDHVVGVATCYDLRFPELARVLVDQGANVLVYPSAWLAGLLKEDHWQVLLRARAIENVSWVIGVNQAEGPHTGRSMAVDPMGIVIAGLTEKPGLEFVDVDAERTASVRQRNPSLDNRCFGVHLLPPELRPRPRWPRT